MKVDHGLLVDYASVVVDTNVLLSAALSLTVLPATLLDWLLIERRLVFSEATFTELETRIWKSKFDRYLPIERRKRLLHQLASSAGWFQIPPEIAGLSFSRDSKDDAFVQLAMVAQVNRLITGDDDLLCLHPLDRLHILTPRSAWDEIVSLQHQNV